MPAPLDECERSKPHPCPRGGTKATGHRAASSWAGLGLGNARRPIKHKAVVTQTGVGFNRVFAQAVLTAGVEAHRTFVDIRFADGVVALTGAPEFFAGNA